MWVFSQVSVDPVIQGFGWQAGVVIIALVTAVVYLFRKWDGERDKRLTDAKEYNAQVEDLHGSLIRGNKTIIKLLQDAKKDERASQNRGA
jgi:hypothetical protein